ADTVGAPAGNATVGIQRAAEVEPADHLLLDAAQAADGLRQVEAQRAAAVADLALLVVAPALQAAGLQGGAAMVAAQPDAAHAGLQADDILDAGRAEWRVLKATAELAEQRVADAAQRSAGEQQAGMRIAGRHR